MRQLLQFMVTIFHDGKLFIYLFLAVTLISIDLFCKFERKQLRGEKSKESSKF